MMYLVVIPLLLTVMPWLAVRFVFATEASRRLRYMQAVPYLLITAGLWVLSFFLPNIPVSSETETFSQHAAGGIAACVLYLFACKAYDWRFGEWWQPWVVLYGFVSALGVLNELFELFVTKTGLSFIDGSDVWWDLLANNLGAFATLACYEAVRYLRRTRVR